MLATTLPDVPLPLERLRPPRDPAQEGDELRSLREGFRGEPKITQVEMAQLLDVSPATYSRWERGLILCPWAVLELMRAWAREQAQDKRPSKRTKK